MTDGTAQPVWLRAASPVPGIGQLYGYETADAQVSTHRGLPSSALTFIISLGDRVQGTDRPDRAPLAPGGFAHEVLVGCLHMRPAYVHAPRRQVGVQMAVHPLAARRIFGVPASALSDFTHEGRDLLGRRVDELRSRLEEQPRWEDRLVALREFLYHRLGRADGAAGSAGRAVRPELHRGWQLLASSGGTLPVAAVAREVGLSVRQFSKVWTAEVGAGPKEVARVMRFEGTVERLKAEAAEGRRPLLARVAAEGGYTDQSHLVREFQQFAGCAPTRWMAEELPLPAGSSDSSKR